MAKNNRYIPICSLKLVRERYTGYDSTVCNMNDARQVLAPHFKDAAVEKVVILGMNNSNKPTVLYILEGAVDQCAIYPSTAFKILLLANTKQFIMAHNHPGGSTVASQADWAITEKLMKGAAVLDIDMQDHLIFSADCSKTISMREGCKREQLQREVKNG